MKSDVEFSGLWSLQKHVILRNCYHKQQENQPYYNKSILLVFHTSARLHRLIYLAFTTYWVRCEKAHLYFQRIPLGLIFRVEPFSSKYHHRVRADVV